MLQQFNFTNYRSFRDDTSLDLTAANITEFEDTVVTRGREKILPVIAIYGANASGKSNVLSALNEMCFYVKYSHLLVKDDINDGGLATDSHMKLKIEDFYSPFRFDSKSVSEPTEFEVYFTDFNGKTVNYGFSIDMEGVAEEWLFITSKSRGSVPKQIIRRNRDENILEFSGIPKKMEENLKIAVRPRPECLVLSLGSVLSIKPLESVYSWFKSVRFIDYGNILNQLKVNATVPVGLSEDEKLRSRLTAYLASFDNSIVGVSAEKIKDENGNTKLKIDILHRTVDGNGAIPLPLDDESDGTKKMFSLFGYLESLMSSGRVIVIDELNAKLHPLLVRHLLTMFIDKTKNPNHAQLIFTCHDAWLMKARILRRDEIWFTEKDNCGLSNLYSLADFVDEDGYKIRKDADYEKNYLLGKYGAIPVLESLDMFAEREYEEYDENE